MKIPYMIEFDVNEITPLEGKLTFDGVDSVIVVRRDPSASTGYRFSVLAARGDPRVVVEAVSRVADA